MGCIHIIGIEYDYVDTKLCNENDVSYLLDPRYKLDFHLFKHCPLCGKLIDHSSYLEQKYSYFGEK